MIAYHQAGLEDYQNYQSTHFFATGAAATNLRRHLHPSHLKKSVPDSLAAIYSQKTEELPDTDKKLFVPNVLLGSTQNMFGISYSDILDTQISNQAICTEDFENHMRQYELANAKETLSELGFKVKIKTKKKRRTLQINW